MQEKQYKKQPLLDGMGRKLAKTSKEEVKHFAQSAYITMSAAAR